MDALGSALKEKTHTWNKSRKESAKRETELFKIKEIVANDEKQEDKESRLKDTLNKLRKERVEENEARALLQEMQRNLDEAHARSSETERKCAENSGNTYIRGNKNWDDRTTSWIRCSFVFVCLLLRGCV